MYEHSIKKTLVLLFFGGLGIFSAFFKPPFEVISYIELFLGFILITYVYLKSAKRQHKHGVFSQWSDPKIFIEMKLDAGEMYLFVLGIIMIMSTLISYTLLLL